MFQEIEKAIFNCTTKLTEYLGTHLTKIEEGQEFRFSSTYFGESSDDFVLFEEEISELPLINNFVVVAMDKNFNLLMVDINDDDQTENIIHVSDISLNDLLAICQYIENNF